MAGSSMTFTYEALGPIVKVIADWVSDDTDGTVSGTTAVKVVGEVVRGVTNPGSAAPTDNYDLVITDEEGANVLGGCDDDLVDRDTTSTEEVYFLVKDHAGTPLAQSVHPAVADLLTFAITNAGNSKTGRAVLYVRGTLHGSF